ncbi:MAG: DNA-binding response OmpR family regulator [Myxococcota bacterium]|jgi:DNA-binding response OmpR family regulator
MSRILLIEDDLKLGELLEEELSRADHTCVWCGDGETGLVELRSSPPDLVLLDLMLPGRWGFHVLEEIRRDSAVPVIVLTARLLGEDKVRALDLGADDYITKPFWTGELLARIRAVMRRAGGSVPAEQGTGFGAVTVHRQTRTVEVDGQDCELTPTEWALLSYFLDRPEQSIRRDELIRAVLPGEGSTRQALQTQVSRLRQKLGVDGERISTVWGIGYRFSP